MQPQLSQTLCQLLMLATAHSANSAARDVHLTASRPASAESVNQSLALTDVSACAIAVLQVPQH
jgi:hypothetical protein